MNVLQIVDVANIVANAVGRRVILNFKATISQNCTDHLLGLEAKRLDLGPRRLVYIGLTKRYTTATNVILPKLEKS